MIPYSLIKVSTDFAPGLPNRNIFGEPEKIKKYNNILALQRHIAERAGEHYDIRLGNPITNLLSWATKKEFPEHPGGVISVYQQPLHSYGYHRFRGAIPSGYGKGSVFPVFESPILINHADNEKILFSIDRGKGIERFLLTKPKRSGSKKPTWKLINVTPNPQLPQKKKYTTITESQAKELIQNLGQSIVSVQPKLDGALVVVRIKDGRVDLFSHRISKKTGRPIVHTERVFGDIPRLSVPKELDNTILLGELYATDTDGNVLPLQELTTELVKKYDPRRKSNLNFKIYLFDAVKFGRQDKDYSDWYNRPYSQRKEVLNKVLNYLPDQFHGPIDATDTQSATQLLNSIVKNKNPYSREGIVLFPEIGPPYKYKVYGEEDLPIVGVTEGTGKYSGRGIGGLLYSDRPGGDPIGTVGTGLSDELREIIYKNPEDVLGRIAKIKYQEKLPSGALRNPVFMGFHESK